jgi:hypothetical protein
VKILFDADTPAPLARFLRGHDVVRSDELGWQGLENGALLDAAENAGFDMLLTCDQNVEYQQILPIAGSPCWFFRRNIGRPYEM